MKKELKKLDKQIVKTSIGKDLNTRDLKKWYLITKKILALQKQLVENKKFEVSKENIEEFINLIGDNLGESNSWVQDQVTKEKVKETFIGERLTSEEMDAWISEHRVLEEMKKKLTEKKFNQTDFKIFSDLISTRIVIEQEIKILKELHSTKLGKLFSPKELKELREIVGKDSLKDFEEEVEKFGVPIKEIEEFYRILIQF